MADPESGEADSGGADGATVEFAAADPEPDEVPPLPIPRADQLRGQMPGFEPERQVNDWGRSQRVEAVVDRTLYGFLYDYWFRVGTEGLENVSDEGGGLLVANHAGALPSDGPMIARAVRAGHPRRRAVHLATEQSYRNVPGLGMLVTKLGAVAAHPANLHRLLFDERELVLLFPEGRRGTRKPLKERYRLRQFEPSFVEIARRAGVPIVPVAIVGTEEAVPVLARLSPVRALRRLPYLPVAPPLPLPAKVSIRFLEPVAPAHQKREGGHDRALADDIRGLIQENLFEMVANRRSVWLG